MISAFFDRMKRYGLAERCGVLLVPKNGAGLAVETSQVFGHTEAELREIIHSADLFEDEALIGPADSSE